MDGSTFIIEAAIMRISQRGVKVSLINSSFLIHSILTLLSSTSCCKFINIGKITEITILPEKIDSYTNKLFAFKILV